VFKDNVELITNEKVIHKFQQEVDFANETFAKWEKIKHFLNLTKLICIYKKRQKERLR